MATTDLRVGFEVFGKVQGELPISAAHYLLQFPERSQVSGSVSIPGIRLWPWDSQGGSKTQTPGALWVKCKGLKPKLNACNSG